MRHEEDRARSTENRSPLPRRIGVS
jgi:hypothetical protein